MSIPFNKPYFSGDEIDAVKKSFDNLHTSGCGPFTKEAEERIRDITSAKNCLLTTSCTHALEICAILLNLEPGDEVIVPSYTFVTSALAFIMHGATPVFCDIRRDTLNIDEDRIEALITDKTKAVVVVHYAGVACEMDRICELTHKHNLVLIEDNAHGLFGSFKGRNLGSMGDLATQSFTKQKIFLAEKAEHCLLIMKNISKELKLFVRKAPIDQGFFEVKLTNTLGWIWAQVMLFQTR